MLDDNLPPGVTQNMIDQHFAPDPPEYELSIITIYRNYGDDEIHVKFHFDRNVTKFMFENDISGEDMAQKPDIITVKESAIDGMDYEQIIEHIINQHNY